MNFSREVKLIIERAGESNPIELNLGQYFLQEIPQEIFSLKGLKRLILNNNRLKYIPKQISQLSDLEELDISFNNLSDLPVEIFYLPKLKNLNLSANKIEQLPKEIRELRDTLIELHISDNLIKTLPEDFAELEILEDLYFRYGVVDTLPFEICELKNLKNLYLNNNNLNKIPPEIANLTSLTKLHIQWNQISDASFLRYLTSLTDLQINNNPIVNPPLEIVESGLNAIRKYYKQLEEEETERIYEAKMLIVGEPGAGKSTLFEKMKNPEYLPQNASKEKKDSTVGIVVEVLPFPYTRDEKIEFKAHLWDFGGQPIQYILHQYFFTERSLYVLLADDRRQLTNFHYWFEIIATLGKDCPVLVVLNELNHKSVSNFDLAEYQREFSGKVRAIDKRDVDFSINDDKRFSLLKDEIENKLCNLEHIGQELPKTWLDVRREIEERSKTAPYIRKSEYDEFCEKHGVKPEYRSQILRYFHDLGIALNYENDENLEDIVILSPNWVIDALYVVLKNTKVKEDCGRFKKSFVFDLWEKEGYEENDDRKFLLGIMQKGKFEVAYKIPFKNEYIVPALLPPETPEYFFGKTNIIQVYFQYGFMPPGILSRLIVRLNENIVRQNGEQIVWEKGVLFERENAVAEVIESTIGKQLTIKVSGDNSIGNKELLTLVRNEIRKIHKDWFDNRLDFQEMVPCICDECIESNPTFYTLEELETRIQRNKTTIECRKSYKDVNVRQLLDGVYIEDKSLARDSHSRKVVYVINQNITNLIDNSTNIKNTEHATVIKNSSNVDITQNFNGDIEEKLEAMFSKLTDIQIAEMKLLAQEIVDFFSEKFDELDPHQQGNFENAEKGEWNTKIKLAVPLINLLGISIESERDIKPGEFVSKVRKLLRHNQDEVISILNAEPEQEKKFLI